MKLSEFFELIESYDLPKGFSELRTKIHQKVIDEFEWPHEIIMKNIDIVKKYIHVETEKEVSTYSRETKKFTIEFTESMILTSGLFKMVEDKEGWEFIEFSAEDFARYSEGDEIHYLPEPLQTFTAKELIHSTEHLAVELKERFDEKQCILKRSFRNKFVVEAVNQRFNMKPWLRIWTMEGYKSNWIHTQIPY